MEIVKKNTSYILHKLTEVTKGAEITRNIKKANQKAMFVRQHKLGRIPSKSDRAIMEKITWERIKTDGKGFVFLHYGACHGLIDFPRFEGKECLHLQGLDCQTTQRRVPEERNPQAHRCRNVGTGRLKTA